ncbi:ATP dependent DNA ligase [Sulfurimonas gotlandica GD1]|uniref:ATP dependent DNA ligase n=1 Tax=Sulfurimonas gotlandica (strain DSM 19862 / JCM 16533 / GD1) TaxID=929558 RepID=B6BKK3_SULGG|nr:DNA ligase [Sulfurimonas gotlandica]EDZ62324.1 ATP dependent DNA ligase, central [Sulfurimonas gotlandica GD1]EHP29059.1 ATP dependent DNA ligase [Sulfurimonas gotlandica GD1]
MKYLLVILLFSSLSAHKPELVLLNKYNENINVTSWYMSEKLDGVRAYWDGEKLISRSGKVFASPTFFTKDFPKHELDGELWSKRGDFSNTSSIVNQKKAHNGWRDLTYNIFEVPNAKGNLLERLENVKTSKYIKVIKQIKVKDKKHLDEFLKSVENKGGEGLVVRDASLKYYIGRDNNSLKVKSYSDEECQVVGYNKGKGKYKGLVGSIVCKMDNEQIINIGSGLNDEQRTRPPKIGAIITFKYYGLTSKGKPRFPVFLHERY